MKKFLSLAIVALFVAAPVMAKEGDKCGCSKPKPKTPAVKTATRTVKK